MPLTSRSICMLTERQSSITIAGKGGGGIVRFLPTHLTQLPILMLALKHFKKALGAKQEKHTLYNVA